MFGKKNSPHAAADISTSRELVRVSRKGERSDLALSQEDGDLIRRNGSAQAASAEEGNGSEAKLRSKERALETEDFLKAKNVVIEALVERVDFRSFQGMSDAARRTRVGHVIDEFIAHELTIPLTASQHTLLHNQVVDDLLGFGPIEVLLADPDVSDIMINGHNQVYIEKRGRIFLSDVRFSSEKHLLNVIQKIVSLVGRRVDESSPMVDARMPDGSRFNAIIPPLALNGCLASIRKFKRYKMPLKEYLEHDSLSEAMYKFLEICGYIRLNIIISGGTGSGKTTLLNAISGNIDPGERVITIEDAAELQLQQPHVLRLETRPANIEGTGEIGQRQLVKNALRMRPDRIILGEIRGDEVIDVLAAMNTGHDGSMATIHANSPKDALSRIENLVGMSGVTLAATSLRAQIASAVQLIVQLNRMRDGRRRIVQIEEVLGLEGGEVKTRTLFGYKPGPMDEKGVLQGKFYCTGAVPQFMLQAEYYGVHNDMLACIQPTQTGD